MTDAERDERIRHHLYETNEGITEHAERIVAMEQLVRDLWPRAAFTMSPENRASWMERIGELGIEVDDG